MGARAGAELGKPPDIYPAFVKTALVVALTIGCTLGSVNLVLMASGGSTRSVIGPLNEVHGVAQLSGWVGLFVMGIAYHVLPRLKGTELRGRRFAEGSYWLVLAAILLRAVGQPLGVGVLVVLATAAGMLGATLFAGVALATLAGGRQGATFYERYMVAGIAWFWLWAVAALVLTVYQPGGRAGLALHDSHLYVGLMGFAALMILGITLRTVPGFMGLRPPNEKAFGAIFWLLNAGIGGHAAGSVWQGFDGGGPAATLSAAATLLEYGALLAFVYCLGLFGKRAIEIDKTEVVRSCEPFIRAAYGWLIVGATLGTAYVLYEAATGSVVPYALVGAYRHALTIGFISSMIMGMASRMIPVFSGNRLHSPALLQGAFVLLQAGNVLRVVGQSLADALGGPLFALMGGSGLLEVAALIVFGYNIWRTMDVRVEAVVGSQPTRS